MGTHKNFFDIISVITERGHPLPCRASQTPGKTVEPCFRRAKKYTSSDTGLEKTVSNTSAGAPASPTSGRRRSSNSALFGNLTNMKRGSVDYEQRRASHSEHQQSGGVLSGWYNQTFRG